MKTILLAVTLVALGFCAVLVLKNVKKANVDHSRALAEVVDAS